jgi:phosphoglycolate phosphatase-like HAD superfamily hydrolase
MNVQTPPGPPKPVRLILFDVDGTLISTKGLGGEAIGQAVTEVYGVPDPFRGFSLAGRTDTMIIKESMRRAGVPEDRILAGLDRAMARHAEILEQAFRERGRGHLMPGIGPLLDRLGADRRWGLGLLTGNTREGARHKLSFFGIWGRFAFGAYGDDDEDRNRLPAVALRRARDTYGVDVPPRDCCVVGDTVRDIACARAGGMKAVAVATGGNPHDVLAADRPDLLFHSFEDVDGALRQLNEGLPPIPVP